jgi:tight adherence protein B
MLIWLTLLFAVTFAIVAAVVLIAGLALENASPDDSSLFKNEQLSSISVWHSLLARFDFAGILKNQLAQSGLDWSAGRLTLSVLLCGVATFTLVSRASWIPLWAGIGCAWLAALAPYAYVLRVRSKRLDAFASQFPDALDSLSRAMRAGYPLLIGLELVARETLPPASSEIRKVHAETNLGLPIGRALANLCDRVPLLEVDLFAAAVQLHSRTGGRLTDVMAGLAESMREQTALRGEVVAIATHGRVTGAVLTALPIAIAVMMAVVSPMYIGVLLAHPYGKHMIAAAIFCLIAAHFVIARIVDIRI